MKKFLSILLSTLMIFTCMTTNVFAGSPGYTITSESTQNGSFTVKSPVGDIVDRAPENGEITITPTANNGFEVDKVEWKKASAPSYTTITNDSGYKFTMPAEAVSVKVSFKASGATVKFNANTGSGTMSDVTNVSGDYTLPSCTFTAPSGKVFDGWATSVSGTKISTSTYNVSEDVTFYALWKDPSTTISDEVATKIKNGTIHTLYDVGEANLTADDIVTVNGVDCYVLSVNTASNTAQLITKNIYDVRFDNGGHDSSTPNLGTESGYTDKTYNYEYSTLKTYMDNFYTNKLGSDSRIIDHEVTSYTKDSYSDDLSAYSPSTITQKVYALDAVEAKTNASKFGSLSWSDYNAYRDSAYSDNCNAFWVSVGCIDADGKALLFCVHYGGGFECLEFNDDNMCGARPAFTISVSPSTTPYTEDIALTSSNLLAGKTVGEVSVSGFDTDKFELAAINVSNGSTSPLTSDTLLSAGNYSVAVVLKVKDGSNTVFSYNESAFVYSGSISLDGNVTLLTGVGNALDPTDLLPTRDGLTNENAKYLLAAFYNVTVSPSTATVSFNANTGSGLMNDVTIDLGDYTLPTCTFTAPTGKVFDGWATSADGTKISTTTYNVTGDVTLYAKWKDATYTVTFNSKGGSSVSNASANYNTLVTKPDDPTKTGYTFGGWYKEEALTNAWNFTSDKVTADTTLYARWIKVISNSGTTDFPLVDGNAYKEFTKGNTSKSTLHIEGLKPSDVFTNTSSGLHPGLIVMNGTTKLEEGEDKDYTVTEGSLKVNLNKSYLDTLGVGEHTINVYVDKTKEPTTTSYDYKFDVKVKINAVQSSGGSDGSGSTQITTYKAPNTGVGSPANTGDNSNIVAYAITMTSSLFALIACVFVRRKKESE